MKGLLLPKTRAALGGLVGLVFALLSALGFLDVLEELTVDQRLRLRAHKDVGDEVRLVGISDRDVASKLGRWPFPRAVHGDVLDILSALGVRHVAFDILFTERSADPEQDEKLLLSFQKHPNVTLAYHFEQADLRPTAADAEDGSHFIDQGSRFGVDVSAHQFVSGRLPVPPFAPVSARFGAVNVVPDRDGIIRRVPLFFAHGDRLHPSLAMQTVIDALGAEADQISVKPGKEVTIVGTPRGTLRIPIDAHGQYRVNFTGDLNSFTPAFEYLDLYGAVSSKELGGRISAALEGRIALVGLVSTGNTDVVSSSIGRMPGAAVQAMVISNILGGAHLMTPPAWLQAGIIVAAGAFLGLCMWPVRPWLGITVFAVLLTAWCGAAVAASSSDILLPVVPVVATLGVAALGMLGLEVTAARMDRSRVLDILGRYISRPVLTRLVNTGAVAATATERRELTVFFSDIRGFTTWTEKVEPDEVSIRLNEYFAAMTPLVERHGGTLDKFIGDSIMVFMGAPDPMPEHALWAVRMAVEMQKEMRRLNERWKQKGYEPLLVGIGIHTGFVTVGSFGSPSFLDYTVIGRNVNLAARIEASAPGGTILLSSRTHSLVRDSIPTKPHPDVTLKGIPEPQTVFEVIVEDDPISPAET